MKLTKSHCIDSAEDKEKRRDELVEEFDKLRQEYNQEHASLRNKYQDKFDSVLEELNKQMK